MRNYEIETELYRKAVELIETRYPIGWEAQELSTLRKLTTLQVFQSKQRMHLQSYVLN